MFDSMYSTNFDILKILKVYQASKPNIRVLVLASNIPYGTLFLCLSHSFHTFALSMVVESIPPFHDKATLIVIWKVAMDAEVDA